MRGRGEGLSQEEVKPRRGLQGMLNQVKRGQHLQVERYFEAGLRPDEVHQWIKAGIGPEDALQFIQKKIDPIQAKQVLKEEEADDIEERLADIETLKEWKRSNFDSEEAIAWIKAGLSIDEAKQYKKVLRAPVKLDYLQTAYPSLWDKSLSAEENLGIWHKEGLNSIMPPIEFLEEIQENVYSGNPDFRIQDFKEVFDDDFEIKESLRLSTALHQQMDKYRQLKQENLEPIEAYYLSNFSQKISAKEVADWHRAYPELNTTSIENLHNSQISIEEYRPWYKKDTSGKDVIEACVLLNAGFKKPNAETKKWKELSRVEYDILRLGNTVIKEIVDQSFTAQDFQDYIDNYQDGSPHKHHYLGGEHLASRFKDHCQVGNTKAIMLKWDRTAGRNLKVEEIKDLEEKEVLPEKVEEWGKICEAYRKSRNSYYHSYGNRNMNISNAAQDLLILDQKISTSQYEKIKEAEVNYFVASKGKVEARHALYKDLAKHVAESDNIDEDLIWWTEVTPDKNLQESRQLALIWKSENFDAATAKEWNIKALENYSPVWKAQEARILADAGITPRQASSWLNAGFRSDEIADWQEKGVKRPADARKMMAEGITPSNMNELTKYEKAGFSKADALRYLKADLSLEDASLWQKSGIKNPQVILNWKKAGISPKQASQYEKARQANLKKQA